MKVERFKTTMDSRSYKILARQKLWKGTCPICGPHGGCNRGRMRISSCWKNYRKTQYKN